MKLLSIIIVNVKGKENLSRLLQSLSLSTFKDFEIIVIDNVKNESLNNVKTVYINEDKGPAYCRNIGARNSEGKFLLFLDNDTKVPEDSLGHLINFLSSNQYKIVQLKLIREDGTIDSAGGFIDDLGYPYEKYRGERSKNVNSIYPILYAKGAALIISRDVFEKLGGFDEDYFFRI
ncbi:glycosyltransferase family 2 protein [Acidianus brierleyi]|uniref:glycosyltransferase family 2 protein n=1 Tax=Acidianus brierleyi TaxID=41673 RepID=UPI001FEA8DEF|nr:glycosyltransferase [Acidianus brierleyi]